MEEIGSVESRAGIPEPSTTPDDVRQRQIRSGSGWVYAVAGLSAINTISWVANLDFQMVVGLGSTLLATAWTWGAGPVVSAIGITITAVLVGIFATLGFLARKGSRAAFVVALVLYSLDTLLMVWLADWLGVGFHLLGLYGIFSGFRATGTNYVSQPENTQNPVLVPGQTSSLLSRSVAYGLFAIAGAGVLAVAGWLIALFMGSSDMLVDDLAVLLYSTFAGLVILGLLAYVGFRILAGARQRESGSGSALPQDI